MNWPMDERWRRFWGLVDKWVHSIEIPLTDRTICHCFLARQKLWTMFNLDYHLKLDNYQKVLPAAMSSHFCQFQKLSEQPPNKIYRYSMALLINGSWMNYLFLLQNLKWRNWMIWYTTEKIEHLLKGNRLDQIRR